jgi:hypothetical protein
MARIARGGQGGSFSRRPESQAGGTPRQADTARGGDGGQMHSTARGGEGAVPAALRGAGTEGDQALGMKMQRKPAENSDAPNRPEMGGTKPALQL